MTLARLPRAIALLGAALLVGGCASHAASHDPTAGADNPANPNAPAAPPPPAAFTMVRLAGPPRRATPTSAPASQPGAAAASYVCPMHPEVTSNTAGICPKCKMKLEPRKAGSPATAAAPAAPQASSAAHESHDHGGHP
jgi:hypothetical protein